MTDPWGDSLTEPERALLTPFVTDVDAPIFGLRNLPEVVKGALFSRYSRTDKSLRRILLDEFISAPESGFQQLVGGAAGGAAEQLVAVRQAEAFYERVLVGYGDDSVAELGGAHVALEGISNIAAKLVEDARIGISPLEKSTRYVTFDRQVNGRYRYYRPPELTGADHQRFEHAMDGLFDCYSALLQPTIAAVQGRTPRDANTSERAYASATRAKACDLLRGLLPMATLTNVGLFGNGRAFEYLLTKLYASDLAELRALATALQTALDALIPSFVKRPKTERGQALQAYIGGQRARVAAVLGQEGTGVWRQGDTGVGTQRAVSLPPPVSAVTLVDYDQDAELRVVAAILYSHEPLTLTEARAAAEGLGASERAALTAAYAGDRAVRQHRPGRAFEEARYSFDILADIGAYRDLQRHRMLSQERQPYTTRHGFITPDELADAGLAGQYAAALEQAAATFERLWPMLPPVAQYAVPLAFRVRWRFTLNLRELYHLCELRSAPQGHPTYRQIAQQMYAAAAAVHPALTAAMRFVDMQGYALERLAAEQRLDRRLGSG